MVYQSIDIYVSIPVIEYSVMATKHSSGLAQAKDAMTARKKLSSSIIQKDLTAPEGHLNKLDDNPSQRWVSRRLVTSSDSVLQILLRVYLVVRRTPSLIIHSM